MSNSDNKIIKNIILQDSEYYQKMVSEYLYTHKFTRDELEKLKNTKFFDEIRILYWDRDIPVETFPRKLEELYFDYFNQKISDLPTNLRILHFGDYYNHDVDFLLPSTLEILEFGDGFNSFIKVPFPQTLKRLTFGYKYNQKFLHPFPSSLTWLSFGHSFNQLFDFPENLEYLWFGKGFNKKITNPPKTLKYLCIGDQHQWQMANFKDLFTIYYIEH